MLMLLLLLLLLLLPIKRFDESHSWLLVIPDRSIRRRRRDFKSFSKSWRQKNWILESCKKWSEIWDTSLFLKKSWEEFKVTTLTMCSVYSVSPDADSSAGRRSSSPDFTDSDNDSEEDLGLYLEPETGTCLECRRIKNENLELAEKFSRLQRTLDIRNKQNQVWKKIIMHLSFMAQYRHCDNKLK